MAGKSVRTPSATKAIRLVLDAYAAALKSVPTARDPRLRIEHAQVVRREDVERFVASRVIASMQPSHASDDMRWADARLGPARVDGAYAWRWFADAGVTLAHGSDFPVEIVNPFWGIYAGITRQDAAGNPPGGMAPRTATLSWRKHFAVSPRVQPSLVLPKTAWARSRLGFGPT